MSKLAHQFQEGMEDRWSTANTAKLTTSQMHENKGLLLYATEICSSFRAVESKTEIDDYLHIGLLSIVL
jgi:hypothetical protein